MYALVLALAVWALAACVPSFEATECYSGVDCPTGQICVGRICKVAADAGVVEDAGVPEPDGGVADALPTQPDAAPPAPDATAHRQARSRRWRVAWAPAVASAPRTAAGNKRSAPLYSA